MRRFHISNKWAAWISCELICVPKLNGGTHDLLKAVTSVFAIVDFVWRIYINNENNNIHQNNISIINSSLQRSMTKILSSPSFGWCITSVRTQSNHVVEVNNASFVFQPFATVVSGEVTAQLQMFAHVPTDGLVSRNATTRQFIQNHRARFYIININVNWWAIRYEITQDSATYAIICQ